MINGRTLALMFLSGANNLYNNSKYIDSLNVFPVPDGDTGKNMQLTMSEAAALLEKMDFSACDEVAEEVAGATLRSARGNSGVIMSQLIRGFARQAKGYDSLDGRLLAKCLKAGADTAYRAVMKPTEGTILTVARESAQAAVDAGTGELRVLRAAVAEAERSVKNTPELLPRLKEAGVVDAGGMGWLIFLQGMLHALENGQAIAREEPSEATAEAARPDVEEEINFTYCTEFVIKKSGIDAPVAAFREAISPLGDCMMVVDDFDVVKVHIHTDNPGTVIQEGLKVGSLSSIKVDNMREQSSDVQAVKPEKAPRKRYGMVAVASGEGIAALFRELGADMVIEGGQTMNPSAGDILSAVTAVNAEKVFVLPNNGNIILAAQQAAAMYKGEMAVIASKTIPQGIAAAIAFNRDAGFEENIKLMNDTAAGVTTGLVTYAVRDSRSGDVNIREGDIIGIRDGEIVCTGKTPEEVCKRLAEGMSDSASVITLYYGAGTSPDKAEELKDSLQNSLSECEVSLYSGGQPVYFYMVSAE